jgi:hypothetical protein
MFVTELKKICQFILESKTIKEELESVQMLSFFFENSIFLKENFDKNNAQFTNGGIALSSFHASICMDDALRTARFIKSVYSAILVLQERFPNQKSTILYAGCGPYATLLLPLLPLFSRDDLDIILLDINKSSLLSVKKIIAAIGLEQYTIQTIQADATKYIKPDSCTIHLLITETMFKALLMEPQVLVTKNLVPQLDPNGILIPQEINLSFGYSFFANEAFLQNSDSMNVEFFTNPHQNQKNNLFTINKNLDFLEKSDSESCIIESDYFELPQDFSSNPDICIYTEIKIFDNYKLSSAQSYITNPYCLESLYTIAANSKLKFCYHYDSIPKWTYKLKG